MDTGRAQSAGGEGKLLGQLPRQVLAENQYPDEDPGRPESPDMGQGLDGAARILHAHAPQGPPWEGTSKLWKWHHSGTSYVVRTKRG